MRALMAAYATSAIGDGSFQVTSALYITRVVGLTPGQMGVCLSVAWGSGFVASAVIGHLADRAGLRRSAVLLSAGVAAALVPAVLVREGWMFAAVITGYAVTQSGPVGTGAACTAVLLLDAASFVAAVVLARLPSGSALAALPAVRRSEVGFTVLHDRPYLGAAALNAVLHLYLPTLSVALPLYIVARTPAPARGAALVFLVNTVGVLLLLTTLLLTWSGPGWLVLDLIFALTGSALTPVIAWGGRRHKSLLI